MLSGLPSSGKSTRAAQIQAYFEKRIADAKAADPPTEEDIRISKFTVHTLSDPGLSISRLAYLEAKSEKQARGEEYSAIKRLLSKEAVVIADFPNYIKGWRYQLNCESKALSTPSCVVSFLPSLLSPSTDWFRGLHRHTPRPVHEMELRTSRSG